MVDYDQEDVGGCRDLLKTKDGIDQLALYNASVGRLIFILSVYASSLQLKFNNFQFHVEMQIEAYCSRMHLFLC